MQIKRTSENISNENQDDTLEIRRYLNNIAKPDAKPIYNYHPMTVILDFSSVFSVQAEKEEESFCFSRVKNIHKEIPLDLDKIYDIFIDFKSQGAPIRLITKIATEHFNEVQLVAENMRKILVRERKLVPIDKIQQIDNSCIRWLTKQPGRDNAERAGTKQKLMGVVRTESINTLENRVFKAFLKYCIINGRAYLRRYGEKYPNHNRCKAVNRLVKFAIEELNKPSTQSISNLTSMPIPNYVLLQNHSYHTIWEFYKEFVKKTHIVEVMWQNKRRVFAELFNLILVTSIHHSCIKEPSFKHQIWISPSPDKNTGMSLGNTNWNYKDYDKLSDSSYCFDEISQVIKRYHWSDDRFKIKRFNFYYIDEDISPIDDCVKKGGIIYYEGIDEKIDSFITTSALNNEFISKVFEEVTNNVSKFI